MRIDLVGVIVGVGLGALATGLLARSQIGGAVVDSAKRLGIPSGILDSAGGDDPLTTLRKIDPASATQLETAGLVTVVVGAFAAVAGYVIVENLRGD